MLLHTIQMAKWREAVRLGVDLKDITVKSGDKIFAPSWALLTKYKSDYDENYYTKEYTRQMRESYKNNTQEWLDLCRSEEIAVACYCKAETFCHRYILVDMLEKVCKNHDIPFRYKGEIK